METFKGIILTILSVFVVSTISVNNIQKFRQLNKRLARLEMQNIDAELKFDDVIQAIQTLNQSHRDVPIPVVSDTRLDMDDSSNIDADTTSNDVRDAIARFQRGFKEEKRERKLTIASMKREMKTVEDDLRKTVKSELLKVNEAIESDRNRTIYISTQLDTMQTSISDNINDRLDMSLTTIGEHLQEVKKSAEDNGEMIAYMKREIKTVEDDLRKTVKAELLKVNEAIESDRNITIDITTQLDTIQTSIRDTVGYVVNINDSLDMSLTTIREHLQDVKKSEKDNEEMIASMKREMKTVENDLRKTVKAELLKVNEAIESDRNRTIGISTQLDIMQTSISDNIKDSSDMSLTTISEHEVKSEEVIGDYFEEVIEDYFWDY